MNHDSKCGCPDCYYRNFGARGEECPQCYSLVRNERASVYGWHPCVNKWHSERSEAVDQKIDVGTWVNMGGFVSEIRGNEAVVRVDGNCFILALKSIWNPESGAAQEVSPPIPEPVCPMCCKPVFTDGYEGDTRELKAALAEMSQLAHLAKHAMLDKMTQGGLLHLADKIGKAVERAEKLLG